MRPIDADALRADCNIFDAWDAQIVKKWLDDQPTIEAEPVRHGRWDVEYCTCSECGKRATVDILTDYCPHCGAKMDGGD